MREVTRATATTTGLQGDTDMTSVRAVTFISAHQWSAVQHELGATLPWHTRRANLLIDADSLAGLIGKTVQVGAATIRVNAETKPCSYMDELHAGLRSALKPDCRGGVYGSVVQEGEIAVGDAISIVD
jgi:MOSC domain-containing protein YiiM